MNDENAKRTRAIIECLGDLHDHLCRYNLILIDIALSLAGIADALSQIAHSESSKITEPTGTSLKEI